MGEPIATVGDLAGICGHDGTNWEKVLIDASKRLEVAVAAFTAAVEVTQDTPGDLLMGQHQYDGAAWRKSNLLFGYHDRYAEIKSAANVSAGDHGLTFSVVPDGEVWVITSFVAYCSTDNPAACQLFSITAQGNIVLTSRAVVVGGEGIEMCGQAILKKDDYLYALFSTCVLNDDIYAYAMGYKMKLDM